MKYGADKSSKSYNGYFVYADDAEDIKNHIFFRNMRWDAMLERRPPFVPRVKGWEDTRYFDEEAPISDIDSASSDDEEEPQQQIEQDDDKGKAPNRLEPEPKASHHHQEDQHIVPSNALKLNTQVTGGDPKKAVFTLQSPDGQHVADLPVDTPVIEPAGMEHMDPSPQRKRREKKRPRDKILRDRECGKIAMRMREKGAFLGYAYRKPKGVEDVVNEVMAQEHELSSPVSSSPPVGNWTQVLPREEIY